MESRHIETEFSPLHTDRDRDKNRIQIRRRLIFLLAFAALGTMLIAASFSFRDATHIHNPNENASQALTIVVTLVWGGLIIFFWGMKLSPHLHYRRFLGEAYSGLSRAMEGRVVAFDEHTTFRDGLRFYRLLINVGDLKNPEDERQLYWDARLEKPKLAAGSLVSVRVHGNDIIGFHTEEENA